MAIAMKIYLSGPMSGLPEFNYPKFNEAAARLRAEGHHVFNPAEYPFEEMGIRQAFADYCNYICRYADGVYMLPGWEWSAGACVEHDLAVRLGLVVEYLP